MGLNQKSSLLSEEKLIQLALIVKAKKLALLLYNSKMPQDIKEAWVQILPEMTLDQIDRFLDILEAKYLAEQTKKADKKLQKDLKKVFSSFTKKSSKIKSDIEKQIKVLDEILSK